MDKNHKDPEVIDLNVPRRAQYLFFVMVIYFEKMMERLNSED